MGTTGAFAHCGDLRDNLWCILSFRYWQYSKSGDPSVGRRPTASRCGSGHGAACHMPPGMSFTDRAAASLPSRGAKGCVHKLKGAAKRCGPTTFNLPEQQIHQHAERGAESGGQGCSEDCPAHAAALLLYRQETSWSTASAAAKKSSRTPPSHVSSRSRPAHHAAMTAHPAAQVRPAPYRS